MREYRDVVDKSSWPKGPWNDEPDKVQWTDQDTGLPCLIVRGPSGALCGYVGVAPSHPYHGKDHNDLSLDAHGGITFADSCHEGPENRAICHIPNPGEPDNVWWFGFDCAHAFDMCPSPRMFAFTGNTYRSIEYVKAECQSLAKQLKAIS